MSAPFAVMLVALIVWLGVFGYLLRLTAMVRDLERKE
ncbi:MAG: CcmD family protein [Armatimonadota bacterium]